MRSIAFTALLIGAVSPVMSGVVQNRQSVGGVLIPGGNIKFDNCDRKPGEFCTVRETSSCCSSWRTRN